MYSTNSTLEAHLPDSIQVHPGDIVSFKYVLNPHTNSISFPSVYRKRIEFVQFNNIEKGIIFQLLNLNSNLISLYRTKIIKQTKGLLDR